MIPKETIEEIRAKSDIVSIVSEHVSLKKRGRNFLGLCPFHSEKTASFTVSPEKQLFHCFGCGEGGNVIAFLMKMEDLSFLDAVAELGKRLGMAIGKPAAGGLTRSEKDKFYEVINLANKFFVNNLRQESGKEALDYIIKRGIKKETAEIFSLGAAQEGWDDLFKHLISRGVSPKLIEEAGLTLPRESGDGYYDRFRNRLIFPVYDFHGKVIAFSGRSLDGKEPKYLNSPDTPIYRKGNNIFGIQAAKESIKKNKTAVLVEGNIDLLSVYQAGITNVVAPLGTALTGAQCKLLARLADTIIVAFDSDQAGVLAALRSAQTLQEMGIRVKVARIEGAKDPDELIRENGSDAFLRVINNALFFTEFRIRRVIAAKNIAEIEGRAEALREIGKILAGDQNPFTQREYAKLAAGLLRVDSEAVLAEIKKTAAAKPGKRFDLRRETKKPAERGTEAEKFLIGAAIQSPAALERIKNELEAEDFCSAGARQIIPILFEAGFSGLHSVFEQLTDENAKKFLTEALFSESIVDGEQTFVDCIQVLRDERIKKKRSILLRELAVSEKGGEFEKAAQILSSLKSEIS